MFPPPRHPDINNITITTPTTEMPSVQFADMIIDGLSPFESSFTTVDGRDVVNPLRQSVHTISTKISTSSVTASLPDDPFASTSLALPIPWAMRRPTPPPLPSSRVLQPSPTSPRRSRSSTPEPRPSRSRQAPSDLAAAAICNTTTVDESRAPSPADQHRLVARSPLQPPSTSPLGAMPEMPPTTVAFQNSFSAILARDPLVTDSGPDPDATDQPPDALSLLLDHMRSLRGATRYDEVRSTRQPSYAGPMPLGARHPAGPSVQRRPRVRMRVRKRSPTAVARKRSATTKAVVVAAAAEEACHQEETAGAATPSTSASTPIANAP